MIEGLLGGMAGGVEAAEIEQAREFTFLLVRAVSLMKEAHEVVAGERERFDKLAPLFSDIGAASEADDARLRADALGALVEEMDAFLARAKDGGYFL